MSNIKKISAQGNYQILIDSVGILLQEARQRAFQQVNSILVKTYWEIGRHIVLYEQESKERADYGSRLLDTLSKDLKNRYGKGFSRRNVLNMRNFYLVYIKWQAVPAILSWTHIIELLSHPLDIDKGSHFFVCYAIMYDTQGRP
ncbi:MAG: DUF1016 N-terminal domain-containing protein [Candidatus Margulisiibacteriota bacterium]